MSLKILLFFVVADSVQLSFCFRERTFCAYKLNIENRYGFANNPSNRNCQNHGPLRLRGGNNLSYIAAYWLLKMGGKENPTKEEMIELLGSVEANADEDLIDKVVNGLNGKNIEEALAEGEKKLMEDEKFIEAGMKMISGENGGGGKGGGGGAKGGGDESDTSGEAKPVKKAEKKEEKKLEEEEEDEDMGFGLFD